ncbi:MAG: hypothetical protein D6748_14585 [Calditrichaeota bacterium]|nr:MAG: hypothetical protein D6748_14585 [Calditrichota bacterium]
MDNVEVLKSGYQYFAEGNIEGVLGLFDSKIHWNECIGFPFVVGNGIYTGHQAIVEGVFGQIPKHYENFQIEITDLFGSGDKVVMMGHYTGVWKATGKKFKANATHVWTMKDGKATHFFQAVDTAEIINASA